MRRILEVIGQVLGQFTAARQILAVLVSFPFRAASQVDPGAEEGDHSAASVMALITSL